MKAIMLPLTAAALLAAPLVALPATAAEINPPPAAFAKLLECRAISDAAQRLACFDTNVGAMETAVASKDLVIADRAQINTAKRSLFGLNLPSFAIFGGKDDEKVEISEIESIIVSTRLGPDRNWRFVLQDGSKWTQIDRRQMTPDPRKDMPIKIRRAAVGSYLANVGKQIAIRVVREN